MATPPIFSAHNLKVSFGEKPLFTDLSFHIFSQDRICLVGSNGSGKSTLLKVMAGLIEEDGGKFYRSPSLTLSYLPQDVVFPAHQTVRSLFTQDPQFEVENILDRLQCQPEALTSHLSGGEQRRVALAQALVKKASLLLLDEPTNHLDLPTIEWLEGWIASYPGAVVTISHDRRFLEKISRQTWWIDHGFFRVNSKGFSDFERWQEAIWEEEARQQEKLSVHLRQETEWLHKGVTARRKRNQGRLRRLLQLRQERSQRIPLGAGKLKLPAITGDISSRLVVEAESIQKSYGDRCLIRDFTTRILRGDRVGIIGPNGAGKTTLIKIFLGAIPVDSGRIQKGPNLQVIYLDQMKDALKPNQTLWEFLCPTGGSEVVFRTHSLHVVGYLKQFFFKESQARGVIGTLSGGERNRLMLAKALCQSGNVLILDEPTNDLDMDTLDLLEETLSDFDGTLIVVSHDRDFLNRLTTSIIEVGANGQVNEWVGGYDDYLEQKKNQSDGLARSTTVKPKSKLMPTASGSPSRTPTCFSPQPDAKRLSYLEKRDLERLPNEVDQLTHRIQMIEKELEDPTLYSRDPELFQSKIAQREQWMEQRNQMETRWLDLSLKETSLLKKEY
jgi:ATP-binding cassette subfamily F protein uup